MLFDTPGIHKPMHRMNERMVDSAVQSLGQVDLALWVVDVTEALRPRRPLRARPAEEVGQARSCSASTRSTRIAKPKILPIIEQYRHLLDFAEVVPVSALNGDNVDVLVSRLLAHLPEGAPLYPDDFLTDLPERFFVAEMVREQILRHDPRGDPLHARASSSTPSRRRPELVRIEATIFVERDTQKAIVIGKGGPMLKAIGTEARQRHRGLPGRQGVPGPVREGPRELARGHQYPRGDGAGGQPEGMTRIPFDVGDAELRARFLAELLPETLAGLREDARPAWGGMTAQQMVEHLAWIFEISTGDASVECTVPEARRERWKAFLYDAMPMPQEFRNPALTAGLPALRHASLGEARAALALVVGRFLEQARTTPLATRVHPTFGPLAAEEWSRSHFKHVYHHLLQFGLLERDGGVG